VAAPPLLRAHAVQRSIGWPAALGLQLVGPVGELVKRQPEGSCDTVGDIPGWVGYATLKAPDGSGVEVCGVCQGLLGQTDLLST